jgi:serine/threonine/tyrosine-interacting protein
MDPTPVHEKTARPTAPYTRAPSCTRDPPNPIVSWGTHMKFVPRYDNVDPNSLSASDLAILTQNRIELVASDAAPTWTYETRRYAQPILDYLYLGPSTVVRKREWLQDQGITMIIGARDTRQASLNIMDFGQVAKELGIEARYIDVSGVHELNNAFPLAIRMINEHMLRIYREQAMGTSNMDMNRDMESEDIVIDQANFRRGKILVFCETGNERSASIVCAYLMAVFGMNVSEACQFVNYKRFCVGMNENVRHILQAYEDILRAQRTVHQHELKSPLVAFRKAHKRGIEETVENVHAKDNDMTTGIDHERFVGREVFQPFVDN